MAGNARSCNFCGAPGSEMVDGKCQKCGTSYPKSADRGSINHQAGYRRQRRPADPDANGGWSDVVRASEE